ncbi:MAG: ABC transporter ATP-binding protein [Anaerolineae bacterium]
MGRGGAIEARGLSYRYDPAEGLGLSPAEGYALRDVDLTIAPGEYVLLCGASGSGKSTLCRALNGLVPHFHGGRLEGHLTVDGLETRDHPVAELFAHVGLVFQNPQAQLFNSTVERELAFGLESLGLSPSEIRRRVRWAAQVVGIEHLLERSPRQLSGGEEQLVAIGAILALRPAILVLDEPFANLDPAGAARVRAVLREIHRLGTTVVVAEHRLHDLVADADRMVVLHQGRVVLDGPPRQVLREDVTRYGLNLPLSVRLFQEWGRPEVPLTVEEAMTLTPTPTPLPLPPQSWGGPRGGGEGEGGWGVRVRGEGPALEARDLSFAFDGLLALQGVSLTVGRGECVALVGANGSGKTTLVKHFVGLHRPASGQVLVLGRSTRGVRVAELARQVGLVFQNPNDQFFAPSVREEIEVGPQALGLYDPTCCEELIALFGMEPLLERSPYRLSEGEKKRVTFAAVMAWRPEVIVLDEPTTGQDKPFRDGLTRLLGELRARGHTVVLVTHDLEFAEANAGRWIVLAGGRVVADGPPGAVMADEAAMAAANLRPTQAFQLARALGVPYGECVDG